MRLIGLATALTTLACGLFATPANAVPTFKKVWTAKYVDAQANPQFAASVKTAGCHVCHVGKKRANRNAYGTALAELLDRTKYTSKRMREEPEKATQEILAALEKVEAAKSPQGGTFKELFESGKLPANQPGQ